MPLVTPFWASAIDHEKTPKGTHKTQPLFKTPKGTTILKAISSSEMCRFLSQNDRTQGPIVTQDSHQKLKARGSTVLPIVFEPEFVDKHSCDVTFWVCFDRKVLIG